MEYPICVPNALDIVISDISIIDFNLLINKGSLEYPAVTTLNPCFSYNGAFPFITSIKCKQIMIELNSLPAFFISCMPQSETFSS